MVFNFRTYSSSSESVEGDPTPPTSFSLKEIQVATHNFGQNNFLAEGGGDYKFYRGRLADGSLVVVKRACCVDRRRKGLFEAEVQVGSTVSRHPNVLRLRGFCRTKKELLLVYPLMNNSSLSYHLRERSDLFAHPLDWTTRKKIALGAARGLAHLHNQGDIRIMHCDICASKILLNVHFEAVIGGFSLATIMHKRDMKKGTIEWSAYSRSRARGLPLQSITYHPLAFRTSYFYEDVYVDTRRDVRFAIIAPEIFYTGKYAPEYYYTGKCILKSDVFAYGRMLLELITGQPILELDGLPDNENLSLEELIDYSMKENKLGRVIDPNLQGNYVEEEAERLLRLAMLCSDEDPSIRPEMSEVVRMLENQFLQRDTSIRSSCSPSECDSTPYYSLQGDSTPYYSLPPSPSPSHLGIAP